MSGPVAIDSSAVIAVILREPGHERYLAVLNGADENVISTVSLVESGIVLETKLSAAGSRELDQFLRAYDVRVAPVTAEQGRAALSAFWRYGKRLHPAGLNFGDCFSYALAKTEGLPLLYRGSDFARTDILSCEL